MIRLAADIGGTFTDIVLEVDGVLHARKHLTTHHAPEEAILFGTHKLLKELNRSFQDISQFLHGTTLATNAILERKGAKTALLTTDGFRDVIEIADEGRFDQYDLTIEKPKPLLPRDLRFTIKERLDVEGNIILPLEEAALKLLAKTLLHLEIQALAICFLHSFTNPVHEIKAKAALQTLLPQLEISVSHEVSPEMREYERSNTTIANAYVQPLMKSYLQRLQTAFQQQGYSKPILLMTSGGGLCSIEMACQFPVRLIESGPAGGAIMVANLAKSHGIVKALSFDMGGTTAKICLIQKGEPSKALTFEMDRQSRFMKGSGLPIRIPVIDMVEIGAGGGSIAHIDVLKRLKVGPHSAGSNPGAAAFNRGGDKPTVTDADLLNGFIDKNHFAAGTIKLDESLAANAIDTLDLPLTLQKKAEAITVMIDETMSNAARVHAIEKGESLSDYTMIAFGGAAPLHAVAMMKKLKIKRLIIPHNAGVGSAIGFLQSAISFEVVQTKVIPLNALTLHMIDDVKTKAFKQVRLATSAPLKQNVRVYMRYQGQGHEIAVEFKTLSTLRQKFEAAYKKAYSRSLPLGSVEVTAIAANSATKAMLIKPLEPLNALEIPSKAKRFRHDLKLGDTSLSPCLIIDEGTSIHIPKGYKYTILSDLSMLVEEA